MRHCVEEIPCFLNQTATINLMRDRISYPRKKLKAKKKEELTQPRGKRRPKKIKNLFTCLWLWTVFGHHKTRTLSCCHYKKKNPPLFGHHKNPPKKTRHYYGLQTRPRAPSATNGCPTCCNVLWICWPKKKCVATSPGKAAICESLNHRETGLWKPVLLLPSILSSLRSTLPCTLVAAHPSFTITSVLKIKTKWQCISWTEEMKFSPLPRRPRATEYQRPCSKNEKLHTHVYAFWKEKKKRTILEIKSHINNKTIEGKMGWGVNCEAINIITNERIGKNGLIEKERRVIAAIF